MDIDNFESKLDLDQPENVEIEYEKPNFNEDKMDDAEEDYQFLRNKLRFFIAAGEFILSKSINAINENSSPRAIEASSLILRNVLKISETTLNLHSKTKILMKKDDAVEEKSGTNPSKITSSLVDIISEINKIEKK